MGGQHFWFYLDGDVMEPFHEETEDGQENGDGDFIPTFRRGMKRYRIRTGLVPDYMVDAIQRMKLHDHIELTFKTGEIEQIYNVDVEMEWVFEKMCHQATVVLTFDMDEKIVVGACCDNLSIGEEEPEPEPIPDIYWIAANGDDNSGNGTYISPWKTLAYAASQATVSGDIIHVKAGTYYETTQTVLAAGVSILGAGATSIITTATALNPMIAMISTIQGTNGNQSISYVTIDGDNTALTAINCKARSNVTLHHCTIKNFIHAADSRNTVNFDGRYTGSAEPTIYGTGLRVYNCTFNDCGQDFEYSAGTYFSNAALVISGQNGALIYNNTFTNAAGHYGYGIRCINGYLRGVKIYDNNIQVNLHDTAGIYSYAFAIELWTGRGGVEIYRNTCTGGIDIAGYGWNDAYGYGFAVKVYENTLILAAQPVTIEAGILLESGITGGAYIYRNYVKNFQTALTLSLTEVSPVQGMDGIYIYYNIFAEIGQNATMTGYSMQYTMVKTSASYTPAINDFRVYNNIFYRSAGTVQIYGINMVAKDAVTGLGADWSNISVQNNIWFNVFTPCKWEDQTVDEITVSNNISYNATNNNRLVNCVVTNDHLTAMLTGDPAFVRAVDYHLQAGSPAINAGVATGQAFITTDYDGDAIANPPEIGAYEF
jgi:hypothetical protein